jgi:nucleoside-diphosphate-sugar epimerase
VARICLDASLARATWGWTPVVKLDEGVRRVVEHVVATSSVKGVR